MKKSHSLIFLTTLLALNVSTHSVADEGLGVRFTDPAWDGKKIPAGQMCQKFGGANARSPSLMIENIPAGADALLMAFNDESYTPMDKGGHGVLSFAHDGSATASLPAVSGETDSLPAGVTAFTKHRGTGWSGTGGAYLPPCSGGRGNTYTITISVVKMNSDKTGIANKLAEKKFTLGTY